jgi:hypothetical protein
MDDGGSAAIAEPDPEPKHDGDRIEIGMDQPAQQRAAIAAIAGWRIADARLAVRASS